MKKKTEKKDEEKNPFLKEYSTFSNVKYILGGLFRSQKRMKLLIPLGMVMAVFMQYLWNFLGKFVIDMITAEAEIWKLAALVGGAAAVQAISTCLSSYVVTNKWWRFIGARFDFIRDKNAKLLSMDYENLESPDVMDLHEKASQAGSGNNQGVEGLMHDIDNSLNSLAVIAAGIVIMSTLSPWIILVMVGLSLLQYLVVNTAKKRDKKLVWDVLAPWWRKTGYMGRITTDFDAAKDIRMYSLGGWLMDKYRGLHDYRYKMQKNSQQRWIKASLLNQVLFLLQQAVVYAWLIYGVVNGGITIANFTLYLATVSTFYGYLTTMLNSVADIKDNSRRVSDYRSFIEYPGKAEGKTIPLPEADSFRFEFENVSFKYPKAEKYALKNLSVTLEAGKRLAVVGLNGAGKSTFIKLLLRLYEPTEGRILLNGTDIRSYDRGDYYKIFSPVFQDVEIFAFPMSENVSMKAPEQTDCDKAERCLRLAGMGEKLDSLEKGVHTELLKVFFDDGVDLSGGEKQKLALARALYKDAPVVVLDEPTAALDALAEYKLYQDFDKLIGSKTAVYISHRLSSTRFCDAVAMFKDGEMTEYGTHASLLEKGGDYAEMFAVQAQYYVEGEGEKINA